MAKKKQELSRNGFIKVGFVAKKQDRRNGKKKVGTQQEWFYKSRIRGKKIGVNKKVGIQERKQEFYCSIIV